ncbi:prepilin-type N-terminal cleavage/methylation domain-containing protein [Synechococcus sp. AH-551-G15]|nr:prepilin-type N-terminal cleavage/methylation domain-containing protein [Synechococcus sp. AH-551-G15]
MNKLLKRLHKHQDQRQSGLTLVELLIAMSVSSVVVIAATNLVIQSMQWRANVEELRRKRSEWNLARRFVEEEVTSSTRVITDPTAIEIPEECGMENDKFKFTHAIVFPLERPMRVKDDSSLREDFQVLPPAIYGVEEINDGSVVSGNGLVRCGPRINHGSSYGGFYEAELCADGQDTNCREVILDNLGSNDDCKDGFCVNVTACESDELGRGLRFYLLANGLSTSSRSPYGQCLGTQSRVAPVHYFPDTKNVCSGEGNISRRNLLYLSKDPSKDDAFYGPEGNRTLELPQGAIGGDQQVVMCGANFFDVIKGSDQNDIIAASDITSTKSDKAVEISGGGDDDRLLGGDGNDTIKGGAGDDVLIGGKGNDTLIGGSGKNTYLVGEGDDIVEGSDGVDIIFIPKPKSDFSELDSCSKSNCVLTDSSEPGFTTTITNGDVLIFLDGRKRLE